MPTSVRRRLFRDPALVAAVFAVGVFAGAANGCKRVKYEDTEKVDLIDQACCQEADAELQSFKGCILKSGECPKSHKWWMRGQVTCTAVDEAGCSGGRCCNYIQQYDPKVGEGDPDWKPPGFEEPPETDWSSKDEGDGGDEAGRADEPGDGKAPAPRKEPEEPQEPSAPTVVITLDGTGAASINGETLEGDALNNRLCETAKALPDVALSVQAEADTPHAAVMPVLDAAKSCGISRVQLEQTTD